MFNIVDTGKELKKIRIGHLWRRSDVTKLTNVSEDILQKIEEGKIVPTIEEQLCLCDLYGVAWVALFPAM